MLTWGLLAEHWLKTLEGRPSARKAHVIVDRYLRPALGDLDPLFVTPGALVRLRDSLSDTPGIANQCVAYAKAVLNHAKREGFIDEHRAKGIGRIKLGNRGARSLTQADYRAILDVLSDEKSSWSPFVRLAVRLVVVTGLRRQEAAGLRWSDAKGDHLLILRHKMARATGPKKIVLSTAARDVLTLARMAPDRWRCEHPREWTVGERLVRSPFVFPSITRRATATHVSPEAMLRCWHELVRPTLGLPDSFGLHGLRGAFVNLCHEAGLPVTATAALVGHENWRTTLTYYSRPTDQQLTRAGERVARLIIGGGR